MTELKLPSGLRLRMYHDKLGEYHFYIVSNGTDPIWNPGIAYEITEREYQALLPLAGEGTGE